MDDYRGVLALGYQLEDVQWDAVNGQLGKFRWKWMKNVALGGDPDGQNNRQICSRLEQQIRRQVEVAGCSAESNLLVLAVEAVDAGKNYLDEAETETVAVDTVAVAVDMMSG